MYGLSHQTQGAMIGDTITGAGLALSPSTPVIIDNSVEFGGILGELTFDFSEGELTISKPTGLGTSWSDFGDYVFSGFDDEITGFALDSNSGFNPSSFITDNSFTSSSLTLVMSPGSAGGHAQATFTITQNSAVPEPSIGSLLGISLIGLVGVGAVRKIRQKAVVKVKS